MGWLAGRRAPPVAVGAGFTDATCADAPAAAGATEAFAACVFFPFEFAGGAGAATLAIATPVWPPVGALLP